MREYVIDIAFTDSVKKIQAERGSRNSYANMEQNSGWEYTINSFLRDFISARDSFYIASVNSEGQPYIQHRGGEKGFLKIVDQNTLGFADFIGNRQYISLGNIEDNNKVSLFLMDYPNKVRVKIWGTVEVNTTDQKLIEQLSDSAYKGKVEQTFLIHIEAWDRNCPQHITPRYTKEEFDQLGEI